MAVPSEQLATVSREITPAVINEAPVTIEQHDSPNVMPPTEIVQSTMAIQVAEAINVAHTSVSEKPAIENTEQLVQSEDKTMHTAVAASIETPAVITTTENHTVIEHIETVVFPLKELEPQPVHIEDAFEPNIDFEYELSLPQETIPTIDITELYSELPPAAPWPEIDSAPMLEVEDHAVEFLPLDITRPEVSLMLHEQFIAALQHAETDMETTGDEMFDENTVAVAATLSERIEAAPEPVLEVVEHILEQVTVLSHRLEYLQNNPELASPIETAGIAAKIEESCEELLEVLGMEATEESIAAVRVILLRAYVRSSPYLMAHTFTADTRGSSHEVKPFALEIVQQQLQDDNDYFDMHRLLDMLKPFFTKTVSL